VLRKLFPSRSLLALHRVSFRRQESIFIGLNLLILGVFVFYPCVKPTRLPMASSGIGVVLKTEEHRLVNNVLEPERAREELLREEKLAVMGRLSNSIAHEIRDSRTIVCFSLRPLSNREIQAR
jgi:hypothetical protein